MKLLHTSEFRTTSDSNAQVDTVERYTFPDGQPYREIAVKVDADMTVDEARRLIADLQHAIALAEEFDAPEREDVSTDDQPKPREETCGAGVEWSADRDQFFTGERPAAPRVFDTDSTCPDDVTRVLVDGVPWERVGYSQMFGESTWRPVNEQEPRAERATLWGDLLDDHDVSEMLADSEQVTR